MVAKRLKKNYIFLIAQTCKGRYIKWGTVYKNMEQGGNALANFRGPQGPFFIQI